MTEKTHAPTAADAFPEIRQVDLAAPGRWLRAGWSDLRRGGSASLFYGTCFAVGGWLTQLVFAHAYALFAGLVTGFLLVAPFLAMGLYDLSRRLERGEAPNLMVTLTAWRPNLANIGVLAAVLAVVLLVWARASMVIFALFFDAAALPSFADVVLAIVAFEQPEFALVYFMVGGFFALFVFAISVVAVPLMLDRGTDAVTAGIASIGACARNPGPMLLWAATITLLVGLGMATLFLGLIVVMPLLGHATWHAYRELTVAPATGNEGNG
ncbi:MAG: hypothetical protein CVU18_17560 [Betaproteobacteria bacterium HGW-Betaproteobacteria-12]|nr:MAG: hypothetical protein CVU18_17560 [Betaproteobacteria bacterium HGW-Betaproteobacteria-12]